ncbi:hypothetical protein SAMN06297129_1921 [Pseudooceanicola antarcticus]|uniref:Permease n=1 Tax=Pseudooceanicola antarcticus TaxID=1247613 RepID=A0A285IS85_9RHOB|nr:permease [Pseudooceanicola antarcticus]PJE31886.1 permease [Pseudooceanicola antarcticus]SNY50693.1 hypothetical protein SAMN06297129_1921 [Pseudooceanicola antarcticus]
MTEMILSRTRLLAARLDGAWVAFVLTLLAIALVDTSYLPEALQLTAGAFLGTLPFLLFAVLAVAYMKATGAETLLGRAFEGRETRMIVMAALLGGLSPFCSCQVIPFIAALLAVGAPLSAVMAFWLSSPLMDPAMFSITTGTLGLDFAIGKTVAAVALGLFGGAVVMAFKGSAVFADPLRARPRASGCGCGPAKPFQGKPVWRFWNEAARRETFRDTALENVLFLGKWLLLAYLLEAVMLRYLPAEWIASLLGGEGLQPIVLGAIVGAPAYLNGYAAVPLVDGLLSQGMAPGAAMSFVIAGGVSSIPAAVAVWALVKPRVFATYLGFAISGAILAGAAWSLVG